MSISRNSTNKELQQLLKEELKSGAVIVTDIIETKNPDYLDVYFIQQLDDVPSRGPSTGEPLTKTKKLLLGWDTSIYRARQNCATRVVKEQLNLEVGKPFPMDDVKLRVYDTLVGWEGQEPVKDGDDNIKTHGGKAIYQQAEILTLDEFEEKGGHSVLSYDIVTTTTTQEEMPERLNNVFTNAGIAGEVVNEK